VSAQDWRDEPGLAWKTPVPRLAAVSRALVAVYVAVRAFLGLGLELNVDYVAAPPIRIAPEKFHGATRVYYAPVDDFELSVTRVADGQAHPLPGRGPRILLCLEGSMTATSEHDGSLALTRGQAAFVPASDGALTVRGGGTLVQADVP